MRTLSIRPGLGLIVLALWLAACATSSNEGAPTSDARLLDGDMPRQLLPIEFTPEPSATPDGTRPP
ncbi:MAG: hypothetical protein ACLFTK_04620, partial [Anaerolineales bacterium]